jgi:CheY-like chemotaxis protein/two-component sensor histidine kinase
MSGRETIAMNPFPVNQQPPVCAPAPRDPAEKLAEAERHKVTTFLLMLAHELRTPLAPLLHSLRIVRLTRDHVLREQALAVMERQVRHMAQLLDALLEASRVATGRIQLHRERLDLARLIGMAAEDYRPILQEADLLLEVDVPKTPVWVLGDAIRLVQILTCLLDNAIRFRNGGNTVTVRVDADPRRQDAVLWVSDHGIGFEAHLLPQLWDLFAQADQGLQRTRGGLGLGLTLVRSLAELHGGRVEARSAGLGFGAEFSVHLPLEPEPAALAETAPAALPPAYGSVAPEVKPLRILVIEDNRDAAVSLQTLLSLLGHQVSVAFSGPEGVGAATRLRPDLVISDIGLPGLDGWGVAQALRQNAATASVKLVALTGYGRDEDRRHAAEVGFDAFLTKPADPDVLQEVLARLGR